MTPARRLTAAEAAVLDVHLPAGLTEEMRDVAWCLFEAMALMDSRAGAQQPGPVWLGVLHAMARVATAQLQHLAIGQFQVQRAVLQALQQAQAVARRGRQAGWQWELKRGGGRVHGQWSDEDEREDERDTGIAGAWGLVWNGTCLSHSSKAFQRMRAITPSVSRG